MAKEAGLNVLLKVGDGGGTEAFTTLSGQKNTNFGGSTATADTTDKSNNGWKTSLATTIDGSVQVQGVCNWGNAQLTRLQTQWRNRATINCQLLLNAALDMYAGAFYVTAFKIDGNVDGVTSYDISLAPASALTYTGA